MTLWPGYILRIIIYMLMGGTLASTSRCTIHTVRHLIWRPGYMCRNIKTLFNFEPPATEEEIVAASLQYVRKVTGFNKPSKTTRRPSTPQSKTSRGSRSGCSPRSKLLHRQRTGKKRRPRRKRAQPYDSVSDHTDRRFTNQHAPMRAPARQDMNRLLPDDQQTGTCIAWTLSELS